MAMFNYQRVISLCLVRGDESDTATTAATAGAWYRWGAPWRRFIAGKISEQNHFSGNFRTLQDHKMEVLYHTVSYKAIFTVGSWNSTFLHVRHGLSLPDLCVEFLFFCCALPSASPPRPPHRLYFTHTHNFLTHTDTTFSYFFTHTFVTHTHTHTQLLRARTHTQLCHTEVFQTKLFGTTLSDVTFL